MYIRVYTYYLYIYIYIYILYTKIYIYVYVDNPHTYLDHETLYRVLGRHILG